MNNQTAPIITVDGPSGAGKGTLTRLITRHLGWNFLDSGALYRVVAVAAGKKQVELSDHDALVEISRDLDVEFKFGDAEVVILLEGEDVTSEVRLETTGNKASQIAPVTEIRDALLQRQRDFRASPGLVADGRDMGTVVFPDANLKLYLTASAEERAKRRYLQLKEKGVDVSIARLADEIKERDDRDMNREVAPLKPATDAIILDSSNLSIEQVFDKALELIQTI